jgi:hypothetical protein
MVEYIKKGIFLNARVMCPLIGRINHHERADESTVQREYNGVPGRKETNGPEDTIVPSILTDLIFKRSNGRRAVSSDPPLNQRSSRVQAMSFEILKYHH